MNSIKKQPFRKNALITVWVMVLMLVLPGRATAQGMPVYDNTNFLSLGKQLIESAKQTAELLKMAEELNAVREKIEKVNNAVRQYQAVRDITKNNEELFEMVGDDLREVLNSPYIHGDEVEVITNAFNGIMEHSLNQLEFMEQVLSNDFLNMSDAERLEILEGQREASQRMLADIKLKKRRYDMVISFRKMQTLIKDRKLNY
ncbi:conjugal transfer protein [Muricauda ruestringensis]|uniref:Conjugal transfer protein n=1 Tax=Flagellimonas aurea TaxID=2915619 RepID=A0ABS3G6J3_9FLAO|nr:conjugal transfer protein [Allomuricauda aurea]MAO16238.1 conjugal transfer protein [Allomuricauda sp.]MBC72565.1 conjugal transfer protein [Allomuricauda sp.]MBO0354669.1 conjugal transfer protein [Allomuricauda aurea]|tara:strand:- start:1531 stop:2136 length:606 start_codon:yes stop_codon:yes gene_type:complete